MPRLDSGVCKFLMASSSELKTPVKIGVGRYKCLFPYSWLARHKCHLGAALPRLCTSA